MANETRTGRPRPADVLVIFGITGDLAKVMTFHSLYRLEQRGLLDCPIIGVAVDDWTLERLHEHAREAIEAAGETLDKEVFARLTDRMSYVSGDFADAATYRRVRGGGRRGGRTRFVPGDPAVPVRDGRRGSGRRGPGARRAGGGGEAVRPRPGVGPGARRRAAPVRRRVADLPDRPLPREDGPRGAALLPVRQHAAGAGVEPPLRRVGPDHDGRELRRRGPRALLRPGRRAARRRRQPPDAGASPPARWSRRPATTRTPLKNQQVALWKAVGDGGPGALRARPVRRLPRHRRGGGGLRPPRPTRALRLEIDNWRWAGVPFFIRTGKRLPVTQTEFRLVLQAGRRGSGSRRVWRTSPTRTRSSCGSTRRPAPGSVSTPSAPTGPAPGRSTSTSTSPSRAGKGRRRTRSCCMPP